MNKFSFLLLIGTGTIAFSGETFAQSFGDVLEQVPAVNITSADQFPLSGAMYVQMPSGRKYIVGGACWPMSSNLSVAQQKSIGRRASHLTARGELSKYLEDLVNTTEVASQNEEVDGYNQTFRGVTKSESEQMIRGAQVLRSFEQDGSYCTNVGFSPNTIAAANEFQKEIKNPTPVQVPVDSKPDTSHIKSNEWVSPDL